MEFLAGVESELSSRSVALTIQLAADVESELSIYRRWWAERRVDGVLVVDLRSTTRVSRRSRAWACRQWSSAARSERRAPLRLARRGVGDRRARRLPRGARPHAHRARRRRAGLRAHGRPQQRLSEKRALSRSPRDRLDGLQPRERRRRDPPAALRPEPPTAIAYDSDVLAVTGLGVVQEMGFSVPGDVSIVAWDDSLLCQVVEPPLTAVSGTSRHTAWLRHGACSTRSTRSGSATSRCRAGAWPAREHRPAAPPPIVCLKDLTLNRISDGLRCTGETIRRRMTGSGGSNYEDRSAERTLARRELLVARRRPAHVGALRRGRRPRGARGARRARAHRHAVVLLLARLRPDARAARRGGAERFADFLDAHVELGLGTIPTFIVGHMSGENWDPAWRDGRDLYRDVWLVSQQAWFAGEIARRFGSHLAVVGWLVSNEMPLYGGPGTSDEIAAWARPSSRRSARPGRRSRSRSATAPGASRSPAADNGYSLRALAPLVDFVGPHSYPMQDDQVRQFLTPAFACELAGRFGKPVVLEEFGVSSDFASDEHAAAYYRQVLHTTLLAGARGWLAWNNCDYDDLRDEDPYRHHVFELHFGLTDRNGEPKPQLRELAEFAELVRELSADGWEPVKGDAAIVVPEHFERVLPFTDPAYRRTSATTSSRRTSPRARPTCRSSSCASATACRPRAALPRAVREAPHGPGLDRLRELAEGARPSTSPTSRAARRTSAGRGSRGWTRSSASATASATASSTRSWTTRWCSSSSRTSAASPPARACRSASRARAAPAPTCPSSCSPREVVAVDATAGRRSSPTSSAAAEPSSAPIRSSTWRRGRRG